MINSSRFRINRRKFDFLRFLLRLFSIFDHPVWRQLAGQSFGQGFPVWLPPQESAAIRGGDQAIERPGNDALELVKKTPDLKVLLAEVGHASA